ncbi:MAG: sugar phosphate nucleotidyltransferase [Pseudomonadota bacterium]
MTITVYPVIMAGGSGTRLWPLSTAGNPKQFQRLLGDRSLFQQTLARVIGRSGPITFALPSVIGGAGHANLIAEQLAEIDVTPHRVLLEPFGRNTTAVAAMAADLAEDPESLVLLLPSDHHMADPSAFRAAIAGAAPATLERGLITTFGIEPTHPETGYGYIRRGGAIDGSLSVCDAFVEKPDLETAIRYLADGNYAWNGGIFLFSPKTMGEELAAHAPEIRSITGRALEHGADTPSGARILDPGIFETCPSVSIDYTVMEKTTRAAVYGPLRCGWSDIGSWSALSDLDPVSERGDVVAIDTSDCYLRSEDGTLLTAIGLEGLVVIASGNTVLVAPKSRVQDVKTIVERLKKDGRDDAI